MTPTMGRIIHAWDDTYHCWRPALSLGAGYGKRAFRAQVFRGFDMVEKQFYYERENKEELGGWRWPPREEA